MSQSPHDVLYDGACPFCRWQVRLLMRLDWFHVLHFVPNSDPSRAQIIPQVSAEQLAESLHCVTADGRIYRGARAFRFMGMRLPLLIPVALVMWIPGVMWIAERIYRKISRNRYLLSRWFGCKEDCVTLPGHTHERESAMRR